MATRITDITVHDIRFPTSDALEGSDAMNTDPNYSAAYVVLKTDGPLEGHGLTFTIGRGNELCVAAIEALKPLVIGLTIDHDANMGGIWKRLTSDSQLRWVGPEKGVIHLATAAIINALWDLYARSEGKPLWKLLVDMRPEQIVSCVPFSYLTDALTPDDALTILQRHESTKQQRTEKMLAQGYPAYTTSAGWLGYSDEKVRKLVRAGIRARLDTFQDEGRPKS